MLDDELAAVAGPDLVSLIGNFTGNATRVSFEDDPDADIPALHCNSVSPLSTLSALLI